MYCSVPSNLQDPAGEGKRAFLYIIQDDRWEERTSMSRVRVYPACGYVTNAMTNKAEVIVAGGYSYGQYISATEIYTLDDDTWRAGVEFTSLCDNFIS